MSHLVRDQERHVLRRHNPSMTRALKSETNGFQPCVFKGEYRVQIDRFEGWILGKVPKD